MTRFTAACLQMRSTRSVEENITALLAMAEAAVAQGARFLQSPEMSNIVERSRAGLFAAIRPEGEDPMLAAMRDFARRHKVHVHLGSLAVREGEKIANRGFLLGPDGGIVARYDKLHLFDVDLPNGESWRESATYTAGRCAVVAPLAAITPAEQGERNPVLGMGICYDLRFPSLFRALAEAGADILTAPACFTRQTGEAHWVVLQRARAIETGSFMISAAQGGLHEDGRETFGHSILVDPWGRVLAEADDQPGPLLATIDLALVADARIRIPTMRHARAIEVARQGFAEARAAE
ncbi:carbon-nitrogen hydrolase family protein [Rhabdaerophilum calidifontis]|uniref:carbon-nitrogen hydrolase family protein n=1 Tax=Rhabdaerophilum calidifontis TaxID=2604328 RepID=UPI00123B8FF2|nr:carbon-nitrogen hydrolase family protein [Rhabdaerophilum calidifontis]